MNLKEEIQFLTTGKLAKDVKKNIILESFIKSFKEDVETFGFNETTELYRLVYGLDDIKRLNEGSLPLMERQMYGATPGEKYIPKKAPNLQGWTRAEKRLEGGVTNNIFQNIWHKIKQFSTSQFTSLKSIIENGEWNKLLALPLFKGALAAGGIATVIAVINKIFKKKLTKEQEDKIKQLGEKK